MYNPLTRLSALAILGIFFAISACSDGVAPDLLTADDPAHAVFGATLLQCPADTPRVAEAMIDRAGGAVRLDRDELALPPDAVPGPTRFRVEAGRSRLVALTIVADGQADFEFARPATVTIDYSRCARRDIDGAPLTVWKIDPESRALIRPMGGVDDKAARTITFETGTLSTFSIAR